VPPPGQAEFSFDGGREIKGWAVSAGLGFLDRPMRLHTTQIKIFPVEQRETLALGGVYQVGNALIVDARMPFAHQTGDRLMGLGDRTPLQATVVGDLTLGARLRVMERETFATYVRGNLTLPTGADFDFAGESRYMFAWMLIGRWTLPGDVVIAGNGGVRFRPREVVVADRLIGDELFGNLGVSVPLPAIHGLYCDENEVRLTGELVGVLGSDVGGKAGASPAEVRVGMTERIRPWLAIAARVGKGIDDHIGAPRFRAMVELVYQGGAR
ncbi:MAG TPA: hypothetical protein VFV99_14745, partial [Kofleriaceae bacterium]|nr:hypothetical protein [Kofleriaceae bacterium]